MSALALVQSDEWFVDVYLRAKHTVISAGYADEISWQEAVDFDFITEHQFLREAAWVVIASGMSDAVVRKKFPSIAAAFLGFRSAAAIARDRGECIQRALLVFNSQPKMKAISAIACLVFELGFDVVKRRIQSEGLIFIDTMPFMGPATSRHLAKNIGLSMAKPDRHLLRIAAAAGCDTPDELCRRISPYVDDNEAVIDLVLWRYATLEPRYVEHFSPPTSVHKAWGGDRLG